MLTAFKELRACHLKPGDVVAAPLGDAGSVTVRSVTPMDGEHGTIRNVFKGVTILQIEFDDYITVMSHPDCVIR